MNRRKLLVIAVITLVLGSAGFWAYQNYRDGLQYKFIRTLKFPAYMSVSYFQQQWDGSILGVCFGLDAPCATYNHATLRFAKTKLYRDAIADTSASLSQQGV